MQKISILSNPKNLSKIRKKIKKISENAGFNKNDTSRLVLAVDEACANIIRHSYLGNRRKKIDITAGVKNGALKIAIRDYGIKPDLKKLTCQRRHKLKPGGLGVYFIRKIMDSIKYNTNYRKGTKLILTKKIYADKNQY